MVKERQEPRPAGLHLSTGKRDLTIQPPWMNAAGFLGFSDESRRVLEPSSLGAFVTSPVSLRPRAPADRPRLTTYLGGYLLHTGLPNPGLKEVVRRHHQRWASLSCPVIVHVLADEPEEFVHMLAALEGIDEVDAVEFGLETRSAEGVATWLTGLATSELPVIARLPLDASDAAVAAARRAGAAAVSFGAPRGALHGKDGQIVHGRLYGPALLPRALERITRLADSQGIPLIAGGGVYSKKDRDALLGAGAAAVQFDAVLWTEPEAVLS